MKKLLSLSLSMSIFLIGCAKKTQQNARPSDDNQGYNERQSGQGADDDYVGGGGESGVYDQSSAIREASGNYLALDRVFFGFDRSDLTEQSLDVLRKYSSAAKETDLTGKVLFIDGHTDIRGTAEYNMALGYRRATAVQKQFKKLGLKVDMQVKSYGKFKPYIDEQNIEAYKQNRRTEFYLVNKKD